MIGTTTPGTSLWTTVSAHQILQGNNVNAKDRKLVVDKVAAAVMLQSWLDAQKKNLIDG